MFTGKNVGDTVKNGETIIHVGEGGSIITRMPDGWYAKYACYLSVFADEFFSNWQTVAARFQIA